MMIFADKLIQLRKKSGWSQEELADQMHVTRQSVSKWEGAQSVPDLDKIIRLSELFGVSIDYLLKDELEDSGVAYETSEEETESVRRVSMEEASEFLLVKKNTAGPIANGVLLCILSPICLIVLGVLSEIPKYGLSENVAAGMGMVVLLLMIAVAVTLFIYCGSKTSPFEYLEKEVFETEYGVVSMVKDRKEQFESLHTQCNIIGVALCILAILPLFVGVMIDDESDLLMVLMLSVTLALVGVGVNILVRVGVIWESFAKLLQEGDYARKKKARMPFVNAFAGAYWLIATAIYLGYSLATNRWASSWIIWVVAGVVYPALLAVINGLLALSNKNGK